MKSYFYYYFYYAGAKIGDFLPIMGYILLFIGVKTVGNNISDCPRYLNQRFCSLTDSTHMKIIK